MSLDLGDLRDLAGALGLLDDHDNLVTDWFSRPDHYLSSVLRDEHQRTALLTIVGDLLDAGSADVDPAGRQWLPLVRLPDGAFSAYCVVGGTAAAVEIGTGVRVGVTSASGVGCAAQVYVPLFTQPANGSATTLLPGTAGALVRTSLALTLPAGTSTGGVELGGVALDVDIPTHPADSPRFGLVLTGLRLPGAAAPTDLHVTADGIDELGTSLLHLVLGLVQAEAGALAPDEPLRGLAAMLGLGTDNIPDFPVEALLTRGPAALADWLAQSLTEPAARADWLQGLATLLGGALTGAPTDPGTQVQLPVGPAQLLIGLTVAPVAGGRPRVTPTLTLTVDGAAGVTLALDVAPVCLDLSTGTALALPALRLAVRLRGTSGPLLSPITGPAGLAVGLDGLDAGFTLDAARRPLLVLQALNADVGSSHFEVLDLTSPDALAGALDGVVSGVAASLLSGLGPAGQAVGALIGLADAPDGTQLPRVDATRLLSDPLGALAARWDALLTGSAGAVDAVLTVLRDTLADPAQQAVPVTGDGSAEHPWQVPLAAGTRLTGRYVAGVLSIGTLLEIAAADVAGSGVDAGLRAEVTVLEIGLAGAHSGRGVFLPSISGGLRFTATGGGRLAIGTPPLAVSTDVVGLGLIWSTGSDLSGTSAGPAGAGLRWQPIAEGVLLDLGGTQVPLPAPVLAPDGTLSLDGDGWAAIESLAGAAAIAAGQITGCTWPARVAQALGWTAGLSSAAGPHLALADLVTQPEQALRDYAGQVLDVSTSAGPLTALLDVVAALIGAPAGSIGSGRPDEPWRLPLLGSALDAGADLLPSLLTCLEPAGPSTPATTLISGVVNWRPGDPDLPVELLLSSIASEATIDSALRDLLAGRGDLLTGLNDLLARLIGTDGLVTLPDSGLPAGVTGHRLADVAHATRLDQVDLSSLALFGGGAAPPTVLHIAVIGPGQPDVLPPVPADHVADLTGASRPPESFTITLPADPAGAWAVKLGGRADCRLAAGDPDGVAGQAARLAAVLPALVSAAGGPVLVLAHGAAGHPAVRACADLAGVSAVVTIGTPWSPVAVDTLDRVPGAEALRMLSALLPAIDPDEADDDDLALARQLLGVWLGLDPLADPLAELKVPGTATVTGTTPVHAVVGSLAEPTLRRALTAAVASALSGRAGDRAGNPRPAPAATRTGVRLPLLPSIVRGGLACSLLIDLELAGAAASSSGGPGTGAPFEPRLLITFSLGSQTGWLVGGPDPGRAPGIDRPLALRRLTAQVTLPLAGGAATARMDLHDATAFGVSRQVWTVAGGPDAPAGAVPALPEVRALLAEVATRLDAAAADPTIGAIHAGLAAIGLLSAGGASGAVTSASTALGIDPVTLQRLFTDPGGMAAAVRADPARRADLAAALRVLAGDARDAASAGDTVALSFGGDPVTVTATLDLAGRTADLRATGTTGVGWAIDVQLGPASGTPARPSITATVRVGADLPAPAAGPLAAAPQALALLLTGSTTATPPLTATLRLSRPGAVEDLELWPAPDPLAIGRALAGAAPPVLLHTLLQGLRERLAGTAPAASGAVDTVLDGLGLLAAQRPAAAGSDPADPPPPRTLRLPAGLAADPGAWLRGLESGPAALSTALPALVDALRLLLDAGSTPGRLAIAAGVDLQVAAVGGRLELAVHVDDSVFGSGGAPGRLTLDGTAGLSLDPANPAGPGTRPGVDLSLGIAGTGHAQLGVGPRSNGTVGVTLALHPDQGVEIPILPAGPGLGAAVTAAAQGAALKALPTLLDAIASRDPAGPPDTPEEIAGRLVTRLGDALGLRADGPHGRPFDPAALSSFGHDPAAALAARASSIAAGGLNLLIDAVQPALGTPGHYTVTAAGSALVVTIGPVELRWTPGSARVGATVSVPSGLPGVQSLVASVTVDGTGLSSLDLTLGPAAFAAGPITLRPFARVRAGSAPAGGRAVEVGLGAGTDLRLVARVGLSGGGFSLLSSTGPPAMPVESTDPAAVILTAVGAVLDLAGSVTLALPDVAAAIDRPLLGSTARALLTGVLLDPAHTDHIDPALLDPDQLIPRLGTLLSKLASARPAGITIGDVLTLTPVATPDGAGGTSYGVSLDLSGPFPLGGQDVTVALEADASWIHPPAGTVPAGLTLRVLDVPAAGAPAFRPDLTVGGVGVRLARSSGPLLATALTIESLGLSLFADIGLAAGAVSASGGARLELAGLSVGLGGTTGGDNPVASGLMSGSGGSDKPKPRFSPALAIQKHGAADAFVTFTAGDGAGPWWVVIQRGFGPIYIEQVGLAVTMSAQQLASVGLLVDGRVSLLGLTATVDELSLTYLVSTGSPLDPHAWTIDLAGLAVTADLGGVALAGGLRKVPSAAGGTEYLGLLMARLAVYGISVYGGYGLVGPAGDQFASLFLFGAVNGPIGGPPAFFVTGIGGGFGINRSLTYPSDLSQFATYPFVKALDPAARPGDPMAELEQIRGFFPAQRGTFWFAAGLSFTSFALVDGVAVVAVQIGDGGLELALLGLARMALPRPEAALVSVELALLARVSTQEGILLVQAQLTDNSWLLFPAIKLTGGFAFASWFGGANRGQFVLTLGGYHPSFHRDGYPVVPRLGIAVDLYGFLSITGASYFALTSEAVMAGASIIASASFGPAWVHLTVGGDGIVFFDPFWFDVTVYAAISAGISIDVWIGTITISVTLSARVELTGPPFHGRASFSVGPADLTVEFGDTATAPQPVSWAAFVPKYLQEAGPGSATVLAAIAGRGAVVPPGAATNGAARSPDGSSDHPFLLTPEFELTVTSLAPIRTLVTGAATVDLPTVPEISAAPMRAPATPTVTLTFVGPAHLSPADQVMKLARDPQPLGTFAVGTWGPAQSQDDPKVPRGDVITAVDRVALTASADVAVSPNGAPAIPYRQVEVDPRHRRRPLPFVTEGAAARLADLGAASAELAGLVPPVPPGSTTLQVAAGLLAQRAGRSLADVGSWGGDRRSQPILGSLGEGLGQAWTPAPVEQVTPPGPPDPVPPRPPALRALLTSPIGLAAAPTLLVGGPAPAAAPGAAVLAGAADGAPAIGPMPASSPGGQVTTVPTRGTAPVTSVSDALLGRFPGYLTATPPTLADVDGGLAGAVPARLLRIPDPAAQVGKTALAAGAVPVSRSGRSGVEVVAGRGQDQGSAGYLTGLAAALRSPGAAPVHPAGGSDQAGGMPIAAGTVAVLQMPDADRDVDPGRRPQLTVSEGGVVLLGVGPGGRILAHQQLQAGAVLPVPAGVRVIALHPAPSPARAGSMASPDRLEVYGWDAATPLPYLGDEVLLAAGAVLTSSGRVPWRRALRVATGWVAPDSVIAGPTSVTTRFAAAVTTVAVALEGGAGDDDFALGLEGAARPLGTDGNPLAPVLVADGARAIAVFAVQPDLLPDGTSAAVSVTVTTGAQRRLAGVAATTGGGVSALAAAFAQRGFADVVPDPVPTGTTPAVLAWKEP